MITCLSIGYYSDRAKIYYLHTGNNIALLLFLSVMVFEVATKDIADLGILFDIGLTLGLGFHICTFMLAIS